MQEALIPASASWSVTARAAGDPIDLPPGLGGIVVEDRGDPEALTPETLVMEEGGAEVAEADQRRGPLAVEAEDPLELGLEAGHVIARSPHTELGEVGETLADLRELRLIEPPAWSPRFSRGRPALIRLLRRSCSRDRSVV